MERNSIVYKTYVEILKREMICAMGCTEPIALAYCAATARAALGALPDDKKPQAGLQCRSCEQVCPQQIKISEVLADFSSRL